MILLTSYEIRRGGRGARSFLVYPGFSSFCSDQSNNGKNNTDMQSLIACSQFTINLFVHRRLFFGYFSYSAAAKRAQKDFFFLRAELFQIPSG